MLETRRLDDIGLKVNMANARFIMREAWVLHVYRKSAGLVWVLYIMWIKCEYILPNIEYCLGIPLARKDEFHYLDDGQASAKLEYL